MNEEDILDAQPDNLLAEMFNVYFNSSIMLTDRGYDIKVMDLTGDKKKDKALFIKNYQRMPHYFHMPHKTFNKEMIMIYDPSAEKKEKQQLVRSSIDNADNDIDKEIKTVDAIYITRMTQKLKLKRESLKCMRLNHFEQFHFKNLCCDLPRHKLVPRHTIVRDKEIIGKLIAQYGTAMMKLLRSDPLPAWYGLTKGNIIILEYDNPISIREICYKLIV